MAVSCCLLVAIGAEHAGKLGTGLVQGAGDLARRRLNETDQLAAELVERWQTGKRAHALGIEHLGSHRSAKDHELVVRLGEFDGNFRRCHGIVGKGDASRPLQQVRDTLGIGAFERELDEPVLRHLDPPARALHVAAEPGHVGDGQARVMSDDDHASFGDGIVKRRHDFALLCSIHYSLRLLRLRARALDLGCTCRKKRGAGDRLPRSSKRRSVACPARTRNCARANYEVQTDLQVAGIPHPSNRSSPVSCRPERLKRSPAPAVSDRFAPLRKENGPSGLNLSPETLKTQPAPPTRFAGSIFTPGPMVEATATFFKNVPLAREGFAFLTASAKARMFSTSASSVKLALPTPAWIRPAFSTLNSTAPPLAARTEVPTSAVTVPTFGFGISPRGPSTF